MDTKPHEHPIRGSGRNQGRDEMASVYTGAFIPRDEGFDVSVNGMGQISIVPAGGSADIHICMSPAEAITFGERLLAAAEQSKRNQAVAA